MCHIATINKLPTSAMPCLGHRGEVADREADGCVVLKRLGIATEGGHNRQCFEPSAPQVDGQAVEESTIAMARFELEQPLRVCSMQEMSHGATFCGAEVLYMMLLKLDNPEGVDVGIVAADVSPHATDGNVWGNDDGKAASRRALEEMEGALQRSKGTSKRPSPWRAVVSEVRGGQRQVQAICVTVWLTQNNESSVVQVGGVCLEEWSAELPRYTPYEMLQFELQRPG
jgi:hypothetical protein